MKKILLPLSVFSMMLSSACSEDNTVFNDPSPILVYETDAGILIVARSNTPQPCHSYTLTNDGSFDWSVKGMNLVGDGTLSVLFSR